MNRLYDPNKVGPFGVTYGDMVSEIVAKEKKAGKDKDTMSFTKTMEFLSRIWTEALVRDLEMASKYDRDGKKRKQPTKNSGGQ